MSVLALHHHADEWDFRRYGAAAITIVLLHAVVIASVLSWYKRPEPVGTTLQAIFVDLPPAPAAPKIQTQDLPPGPQVQEAETPPPEPPKVEKIEEQLPPTPLQPEATVAAPPKDEPKPEKKVEPAPPKPQQIKEVKKPAKRLVQATTAARADRIAPDAPAQASGASAAAAFASYRSQLVAHLQRFKRVPPGAEIRGVPLALVAFTVSRNGGVSGIGLTKSTGIPAFDQEALAWIQRAQPMPPFPSEMREASSLFTAPLRWEAR